MLPSNNPSSATRRFYERISKTNRIENLEIPHSSTYFIRWLIWEKKGKWFEIDHVQISLWLEGCLNPDDLKAIPTWYIDKYFNGVSPNMTQLREEITIKYKARQAILQGSDEPQESK